MTTLPGYNLYSARGCGRELQCRDVPAVAIVCDEVLPARDDKARLPKCTTEQVLKMKEMNLTDAQVRAACD